MKSAAFMSCLLMLGIFLLPNFVAGQEATGSVSVEVTGVGKDADSALRNALYQAVEQAVGAYVDSETVIKNDEVIREKLLSVAQGFVEKYEVIQPPRERSDGSGVWETKVSASVKRSEVGAALRAAGVMQVAADGTAAWAEQITRLKSREDAMELLEKLIPEIPRNLFVFSIVGGNGEFRTVEDRNTGDRLTVVTLRLQSNLDWWHAEALPALEAALKVLMLSDAEPVIFEGPNETPPKDFMGARSGTRVSGGNFHTLKPLRGFFWYKNLGSGFPDADVLKRRSGGIFEGSIFHVRLKPYGLPKATGYFLPTLYDEKLRQIQRQVSENFEVSAVSSIDFLDASGVSLKRSSLAFPFDLEFIDGGFTPFLRLVNNGLSLDWHYATSSPGATRTLPEHNNSWLAQTTLCTDIELEFVLPIEAEVLKDTKSLNLVPGTFSVTDGPLP